MTKPPPRALRATITLILVPVASLATVVLAMFLVRIGQPAGARRIFDTELGMRADEVMSAFTHARRGTWRTGTGYDTTLSWDRTSRAPSHDIPARARFEFYRSELAAIRITFDQGTPDHNILSPLGIRPVRARGGAMTWDEHGSFSILMPEGDGHRSLFVIDQRSARHEGEIEILRRIPRLGGR